ncbi:MAG: hypothetical protein IKP92_02785 [Lachnospiraceae bacterium]|nr:hypothetical protein [Lachnospiraceae bacterium]
MIENCFTVKEAGRRRKGYLALGLSMVLVLSLFPGCTNAKTKEAKTDRITEMLNQMTLEEKIGQMMIPSFRVWTDLRVELPEGENPEKINITELNDEIRECVEKNHFGGTILFAENFKDAEQTYRLVYDLQETNRRGSNIPLIVTVDQEGGSVSRIGFGTTGIGNMALAATGDPGAAKEMASIHGNELKALGINADFAPVLDVNNNASNPVIGVRSFSDDPEIVSEYGVAFLEGMQNTGVISTLKHFPGHGDTDTDSHTGFPSINKTYEELKACELVPFRAAINNGAEMIMTAHIQYPQIEKETYISTTTGEKVCLPATMSKTILTDILRGDMGFDGVIVTDALDMGAITDNFEFEDVICMTINAGADMLILPIITNTDLFEQTNGVVELTTGLVKEGKISEETIDAAVRRILTLKEKHGILDQMDFTVTKEGIDNAKAVVGSEENRSATWSLATKSLTLVKNENEAYPLKDSDADTLILFADSCASRVGYGELVKEKLGNGNITVMKNDKENGEECVKAALDSENVILISREYSQACLDPETDDGFSTAVFDEIIEKRHEAGKTVIVISCQLPYDAARFPDADAMILAYCSSSMREVPPKSGEGSAYSPNLAAAIMSCFEGNALTGRLPVEIPKLDNSYKITKDVMYSKRD